MLGPHAACVLVVGERYTAAVDPIDRTAKAARQGRFRSLKGDSYRHYDLTARPAAQK
jgi:hypothetical protein